MLNSFRRVARLILFGCIAISGISASLPKEIVKMVEQNKIDPRNLSIYITDTKRGRIIASHREGMYRTPASVVKLLTTYAALIDLGAGFRWPTRFYYTGTFSKGTINGNLIVKPYGDPTLSYKHIVSIVKQLKRFGIKRITGDMIIDRSFFAVGDRINSGFDKNSYSEYNAMPDAMMVDDHLCKFIIDPRKGSASVWKTIPDESYKIINYLKITDKACSGKYSWPRINVNRSGDSTRVTISGTISKRCPPRRVEKVLSHPYKTFYYILKHEMNSSGIEFKGELKLRGTPQNARTIMTYYSTPLINIISKTNKKSNNLYARHIFLLLGAKHFGPPATEKKGRKAVKKILGKRKIIGTGTILDNGCGLSRHSRLTALTLHRLLQDAYRHYGKKWMRTLSIAGRDGTTRKRFLKSVARNRAWMKTGTLKNAKNIAGYVKGRSGRLYTVIILYNGQKKWQGAQLQNQIIEWIVRNK